MGLNAFSNYKATSCLFLLLLRLLEKQYHKHDNMKHEIVSSQSL